MQRRSAIRHLFIVAGGILVLPSCINNEGKPSIKLKNFDINTDQENLLAEISDIIIPKTDTPGAKELGVHLFVLKMLDDCYEKNKQQLFLEGLEQLENSVRHQYGQSFIRCTEAQKQEVLLNIEEKKDFPETTFEFYQIMKQRTIQGYLNSKYVMTNLQVYEMIPSKKYNGYFPVTNL